MQQQWWLTSPPSTHFREATCREVNCPLWAYGWQTVLPVSDWHTLGSIAYIKGLGLRYREERNDPLLVTFIFEAGQECFNGRLGRHRVSLERPPIFSVVRRGDHRVMEWERWIYDMDKDLRQIKREWEG